MNSLNVHIDFGTEKHKVGQLYLSQEMGRHVFAYDPSFLGTNLEIAPLTMPLGRSTFPAQRNSDLYDLHSTFADALPDHWGRKVQDAEFEKLGIDSHSALQRLAFVGNHGIGAMRFEPAQRFPKGEEIVSLADFRKAAQMILEGTVEDVADQLLKSGGSAGGARPKFLVDISTSDSSAIRYSRGKKTKGFTPIILKVPIGKQDKYQRMEYVYSCIAGDCGIDIPPCHLLIGESSGLAHFGIERFDITAKGRLHTQTLAAVLGVNFRETQLDYSELLRTTQEITRNHQDVVECYRRAAFNRIGCNMDDHTKNFSYLMNSKGEWSLSPAYDIGYSTGMAGMHGMSLNRKFGTFTIGDLRQLAEDFDVQDWMSIIETTAACLEKWPAMAKEADLDSASIRNVGNRINQNIGKVRKNL